jgi:hypothetical protein
MKFLIKFLLIANLLFGAAAKATDYYVNPLGNDSWSGTLKGANVNLTDGPFRTLEKAKKAIRTLKQTNAYNSKVTVNIATGRYYLSEPLNFNLIDSGVPGKDILWQGEPGANVTISAGLRLICKQVNTTFWSCPVTTLPLSTVAIDPGRIKGNAPKFELFVDNQKMHLARWPDKDWAHIQIPLDKNTKFSAMEQMPALQGDITQAQVHTFAYYDWWDEYIGIKSISQSTNDITLASPTAFGLSSGHRFYIENDPSLINAPGEWIIQTAKNILFVNPSSVAPTEIMISSLPNILVATGVNNLTFKNITFQHSTATGIRVSGSNNIAFEQVNINNIGGKGVEISGGTNVQFRNSTIHHTGAHGLEAYGGNRNSLQATGHIIENNHIHHVSENIMTYTPAIGIAGVGTIVSHNLLEQGSGSAILISGNEHLIEKNEIHHFCLQASDCGAIYTGRDWTYRGNKIRYNFIHDILGYGLKSVDLVNKKANYQENGAVGIYLDDGASGFEVIGNIIENTGFAALQIGGGRDNKVYDNYFKTNGYAICLDSRWPGHDWSQLQKNLDASPYKTAIWQQRYPELAAPMANKTWPEGNWIERNIIVTSEPYGRGVFYSVPKGSTVISNNILWSTKSALAIPYNVLESSRNSRAAPWSQWLAEGIEQGSLVADPCVTIVNNKMVTCPTSPITKIGYKPLPTDIGFSQ